MNIRELFALPGTSVSFEFFPPQTEAAETTLLGEVVPAPAVAEAKTEVVREVAGHTTPAAAPAAGALAAAPPVAAPTAPVAPEPEPKPQPERGCIAIRVGRKRG